MLTKGQRIGKNNDSKIVEIEFRESKQPTGFFSSKTKTSYYVSLKTAGGESYSMGCDNPEQAWNEANNWWHDKYGEASEHSSMDDKFWSDAQDEQDEIDTSLEKIDQMRLAMMNRISTTSQQELNEKKSDGESNGEVEFFSSDLLKMILEAKHFDFDYAKTKSGDHLYRLKSHSIRNFNILGRSLPTNSEKIWAIRFIASWSHTNTTVPSIDGVNTWNSRTNLGRFYIDNEGDLLCEFDQIIASTSTNFVFSTILHWQTLLTKVDGREGMFSN